MWSGTGAEDCEKLTEQKGRSDTANWFEDNMHGYLMYGILGLFVSAISGILALVFLIIGIISQRRYRRRMRLEQQGQLNG